PITTQGTTVVTWIYDDGNGNTSTQEQNVVIEDVTDPSISCIENQTIDLNEGETFYTIQGTEFDPISTSDNCGIASIENDFNNLASLEDAQLPIGTSTIIWTIIDNAGNESTCSFDVTVNAYVGIERFSESNISIYPNPTSGIFTLKISKIQDPGKVEIQITDITGQVIMVMPEIQQSQQIDLSKYSNGIYFIKITSPANNFIEKIIRQ
ncbi:MAG: T9SS type A sorting domain-containing protein, partial [Bacteroidota bacterium]